MDRELTTMVGTDVAQALNDHAQAASPSSARTPLRGSVLVLIQFDVCEEIRLDELRKIFAARNAEPVSGGSSYVRYQRPPVEEALEPLILESGERLPARSSTSITAWSASSSNCRSPAIGTRWSTLVPLDLGHELRELALAS